MQNSEVKNKTYTEDETAAIRKRLQAFCESTSTSMKLISKRLGYSDSTLSGWMNANYKGDVEGVTAKVEALLKFEEERNAAPCVRFDFVRSSASIVYFNVALRCHRNRRLGVLTSRSGYGKSECGKEYARRYSWSAVYIEAYHKEKPQSFFSRLHKKIGLSGEGAPSVLRHEITEHLKNTGWLIIVDEAEKLGFDILEALRNIKDQADVGLLLTGLPALFDNMIGGKSSHEQLFTRSAIHAQLPAANVKDVELALEATAPEHVQFAALLHQYSGGCFRVVEMLYEASIDMSINFAEPLTEDLIRQAYDTLLVRKPNNSRA